MIQFLPLVVLAAAFILVFMVLRARKPDNTAYQSAVGLSLSGGIRGGGFGGQGDSGGFGGDSGDTHFISVGGLDNSGVFEEQVLGTAK